ncbi:cadmium transporter [Mesobacillus subterraneus]|uniref:Cd(2+)-exporting ATPase n=1 Tax=Mesobacillus subterraneus TaxID=285983 RepID=A0A0D6ZGS0_9BACI|nr:cadmium transporter [Mesobacillus subterraneus]
MDGVFDAKVNFGASKITVYGNTSMEELERAGAFENLRLFPDNAEAPVGKKKPFWQENANLLLSGAMIIVASLYDEKSVTAILLFLGAIFIGGYTLFKSGIKNLLRLDFDMRALMTVAIIGAAIIGEWSEGAVVVILFAISEVLERYSMDKARASIRSLMDIAPKEALVRRNGREFTIHVKEIEVGDIMIVKPGEKIAMDGDVTAGSSAVNQSAITGESVPAEKNVGNEVFAGSINGEGLMEVKVTKLVEDSTIAKIIHLVEEAQAEKAPSQAFVDRFAKYYTPIIILVAFLVAIVPPLLFNGDWNEWIYQGLAVLVVGCPCALVISTPVSIVTAIGNAAKNGVLVKGGVHLEEMGMLKAVAFDKTGTLTKGVPEVTDFVLLAGTDERKLLAKVAALENKSQHPLAAAIVRKAETVGVPFRQKQIEAFASVTGKGLKGAVDGATFHIGSPAYLNEIVDGGIPSSASDKIAALQAEGKTVMVVGADANLLALIAVADEVRESSREVVARLHELGVEKTIMLTGDNRGTAQAIGSLAGVSDIQSDLLPEEKLAFIKSLQKDHGKVAMVGDGINDAPALAAATVGIAMGGAGTDTALETADIALMADDLKKLPFTIKLSRKTLAIIKQNIAFSIGVKLLALLLVIPGWLTLWIAIFADMGATLIVTLNGLRLLRVKDK